MSWWRNYNLRLASGDLMAAIVVTLLLVPQSMAYAALAGLPPHLGLYASLLPLVAYALFGASPVLAVGPVAIIAALTANALAPIAEPGSPEYVTGAIMLALLSGLILFLAGFARLGQLARLLSHPVIAGFITGAALYIIIGQLGTLTGIQAGGETGAGRLLALLSSLPGFDPVTSALGLTTLALLIFNRCCGSRLLEGAGLAPGQARLAVQLFPSAAVLLAALLVAVLQLDEHTPVVGTLPEGLPQLTLPPMDLALISALWLPAVIISLIGFVESIAVVQGHARRVGIQAHPDAELRGLGAANLASALSGAFPVTGGLSRTAVNADAGARTPLAGVYAAGLMALVLLFATGLFSHLPLAALSALIIVAAWGLIDLATLRRAWHYDRLEGLAFAGTAIGALIAGLETGVAFGVLFTLLLLVWRAGHPHLAVVGRMPGTEHFRNIDRHDVETDPAVLMIRVDENLVFANAEQVEMAVLEQLQLHPQTRELVLVLSSVSHIDATAVETLESLNEGLQRRDIRLHLAEVKGPVMDRLQASGALLRDLSGQVFLSTQHAFTRLAGGDRSSR